MAPITQLGLVFLATTSVALGQRHAHARGHRHLNRRNRPYVSAPYGYSNGTVSAGPTGAAPVPDETTSASAPDVTSTRTETLTSYITQTITADDGEATDGAGEVPVGNDNVPVCGVTQYVTVTQSVTVTAGSEAVAEETPVAEAASSTAAPVAEATTYEEPAAEPTTYEEPAAEPTAAAEPSSYEEPAPVPTTYEEVAPAPTTTAEPTTYEAPSTSSTAAATPTGYSGGNVGSTGLKTKRGCLYEYGKNDCASLAAQGKLSWITNWADSPDTNSGDMVFIPQLWGDKNADGSHDYTKSWQANCQKALDAGSPAIMGFNEPDIASQANLAPAAAAAVWNAHIAGPFGSAGKILVSPGVTSQQQNGVFPGLDWLDSFKAAGVSWDATAVHMYANCAVDANDQVSYLKNMVDGATQRFGKPVWVTEFGCDPVQGGSAEQQAAFMAAAIEYLEGNDNVKQYAAFKADTLAGNAAGSTYASMDSKTPN